MAITLDHYRDRRNRDHRAGRRGLRGAGVRLAARQADHCAQPDANGWKVYELQGTLFFASTANFAGLFDPKADPQHVVIEFHQARVVDHSAVEAIDALAARYLSEGKALHLRHLSPDCLELLERAKDMVEVNEYEDPHYHIADNKLG